MWHSNSCIHGNKQRRRVNYVDVPSVIQSFDWFLRY